MPTVKTGINYEALVLKSRPNAFEYDDGGKVSIILKENVTEECPTCGRKGWTHPKVIGLISAIGSAGSSEYAWKNAAENLGLVEI